VITNNCSVDDGSLFELSDSPYPAGLGPASVAITPSGEFLYVADRQSNQVSQYTVSTLTGSLTANTPAAISTGTNPVWVAAHPSGDYLYAANIGSASISAYKINATSGVLSRAGAPVATSGQPSAIGLK
jgi:6-phosphogluconolactonase (cycloisomerase 2 family)